LRLKSRVRRAAGEVSLPQSLDQSGGKIIIHRTFMGGFLSSSPISRMAVPYRIPQGPPP
jgi:hypothetical protein